jgi:type I restriction enzyme, S subunit
MTERNAHRPGYKKTRVGWIPKNWKVTSLADISSLSGEYGASKPSTDYQKGLPRYIRITDITDDGHLDPKEKCSVVLNNSEFVKYQLRKGDILFARSGATVGKTYTHNDDRKNLAFAGYLIRFRPNSEKLNSRFLHYFTHSSRYWYWVNSTSHTGAQPNINATEYSSLPIPLPPLNEQKKIVEILDTWDQAIEQTRGLIAAKRRLKKGLMQQLLTGRVRFPGFGPAVEKKGELPAGWEERKLGYFLQKKLRKEKRPDHPFTKLGIRSHGKGIFTSVIEDPNQYSMKYFYRVKEDDIIVNITFAWEGAIAHVNKEGHNTLVSHRFPTYVVDCKKMNIYYVKYMIHTRRFFYDLETISPGGAGRNRVLRKSDFLKIKVRFPKIQEQIKIANTINNVDKQIEKLDHLKNQYLNQKYGLMQKLLNGESRVNMPRKAINV